MDQHLLGDAVAVERGREGLAAIPTLSLVMDMADLFGPARGIHMKPYRHGVQWERSTSAELIFLVRKV